MSKLQNILHAAAYLAMGADSVADDDWLQEVWGNGHDGLIAEVTIFAPFAEALAVAGYKIHGDYPGVWAYEVTEPTGVWIVEQAKSGEHGVGGLPPAELIVEHLRQLAYNFFVGTQKISGREAPEGHAEALRQAIWAVEVVTP